MSVSDTGINLTHTCGYCGTRHENAEPDRWSQLNKMLPTGWRHDPRAGQRPDWIGRDDPDPPPEPAVFCSKRCEDTFRKKATEIERVAHEEGRQLMGRLYRERLAAMMLEGKGAVVALGEIATKAEAAAKKKGAKTRGRRKKKGCSDSS